MVKSYNSLYEAGVKLTKGPAGSRTQYGLAPGSAQIGMNNHIRAYGGDFYDAKGEKLTLDQAPAQDAIKWMQKVWRDTAPTFGTGFNADELFANGRIALKQTGWTGQFVPGDAQIAGKFKWDIAQLPKGPKGIVGTQLTINGITMSSITKQQDATWTYIKYMMDPEAQVQIVLNNGGRPAPRDGRAEEPGAAEQAEGPQRLHPPLRQRPGLAGAGQPPLAGVQRGRGSGLRAHLDRGRLAGGGDARSEQQAAGDPQQAQGLSALRRCGYRWGPAPARPRAA